MSTLEDRYLTSLATAYGKLRFCATCRRVLGPEETSMTLCCTCAYGHEMKTRDACDRNKRMYRGHAAGRKDDGIFYEREQREVRRTNELRDANPGISEKDWAKMLRGEFGKE